MEFRFKQFSVRQDKASMKIGTDGVLLGAWAELENSISILDIGTGTGLIALMIAQRNPYAQIDAIDIDESACIQASENILASPWPERIKVIHSSLFDFVASEQYDCILCNPPFFNNSTKCPGLNRTLARHTDSLPHSGLMKNIARLLKKDGNFSTILPVHEAELLQEYGKQYGLFAERITYVHPTPTKPLKRVLMKFTFIPIVAPAEDSIIIELERHKYSDLYKKLTDGFYLNL